MSRINKTGKSKLYKLGFWAKLHFVISRVLVFRLYEESMGVVLMDVNRSQNSARGAKMPLCWDVSFFLPGIRGEILFGQEDKMQHLTTKIKESLVIGSRFANDFYMKLFPLKFDRGRIKVKFVEYRPPL